MIPRVRPCWGETKDEHKKDEDEKGVDHAGRGKRKVSASDGKGSPSPGSPRPTKISATEKTMYDALRKCTRTMAMKLMDSRDSLPK
ncbi:uncharacterized protein FSUBG_8462 [Fusarium subglutinans]|uniref:Uncharacterized protein n=1 Tax=Gibberella subglutinans TaxID=42677 RepID=A0A8H5PIT8_GIBSU|nr:uncharacterized protein FSUBG_8462 [Fusarium subglutinans]KAF5597630.1 hypothetical protein FSUBG_8462 [Fusarium subglutinans]